MKRRFGLITFLIISITFIVLNAYVLSGFYSFYAAEWLSPVFWTFIAGLLIAFIFGIGQVRRTGPGRFFIWTSHTFLMLLAAELVFAVFLLLGDLYRFLISIPGYFSQEGYHSPARNVYWTDFALIMFGLTLILFIYGITRGKYAYRVIRHTLYFDDLPKAFDGFTITQISDVHAGSFTDSAAVQKGIDLIQAQKSDLFVFTGDLVNNKADEIVPYIGHFSQIRAPYGQFSVLGNHDYGDYVQWASGTDKVKNLERLKQYHKALGFQLLLDEHVALQKDGQKIILAGIENWGIGFGERGDLNRALLGTAPEDFKILLSHDPSHWEAQVKNYPSEIHLSLAGHTHGMQFGIEVFGLRWSPVQYRYKHWAGIKSENGRYLNVNRGFGFLGFSGRIGIWPEITVITLKLRK